MKPISILCSLLLIALIAISALAASNSAQSSNRADPVASTVPGVFTFLPVIQQKAGLQATETPTPSPTLTLRPTFTPTATATPSPTPSPLPVDLVAVCCELLYYSSCSEPSPGRLSGYVYNFGPGDAGPFLIVWNSNGQPIGDMQQYIPGLASKEGLEISWEFSLGDVWWAYIWADSLDQVEETDELNNYSEMSTGTPLPPCTPTPTP